MAEALARVVGGNDINLVTKLITIGIVGFTVLIYNMYCRLIGYVTPSHVPCETTMLIFFMIQHVISFIC
jgi:hypothetical protein